VVTHCTAVTGAPSFTDSVCKATLTIVVSKTGARAPTTRIRDILTSAGSSLSGADFPDVAAMPHLHF